jgi:hypothetical protein
MSTPDVEQGTAAVPATAAPPQTTIPEPSSEAQSTQTPSTDLLDVEQGQAENKDSAMQNSLHELD